VVRPNLGGELLLKLLHPGGGLGVVHARVEQLVAQLAHRLLVALLLLRVSVSLVVQCAPLLLCVGVCSQSVRVLALVQIRLLQGVTRGFESSGKHSLTPDFIMTISRHSFGRSFSIRSLMYPVRCVAALIWCSLRIRIWHAIEHPHDHGSRPRPDGGLDPTIRLPKCPWLSLASKQRPLDRQS